MNIFSGHISHIQVSGSLSLIAIAINENVTLKTIVVETPETVGYLKKGNAIRILFKETEVMIAKNEISFQTSIQNILGGTIYSIEKGIIVSKVSIETSIGAVVSVISTEALESLILKLHQKVVVMIKSNEIMIAE
ncbi:molybdopterin-binding protein [Aquimarina sp. RZ0]|uniref:TOBE domain-containing protein n=1 Tax=Aquimarina sp. RZ0 TaxID=2607730 RepID=UPI0011F28B67|nr:TOBE domain-containing protein [Aquimarina sp. RZ0]KAA1246787.1 tobe domain protein [Aquimarina sp. RZ0]